MLPIFDTLFVYPHNRSLFRPDVSRRDSTNDFDVCPFLSILPSMKLTNLFYYSSSQEGRSVTLSTQWPCTCRTGACLTLLALPSTSPGVPATYLLCTRKIKQVMIPSHSLSFSFLLPFIKGTKPIQQRTWYQRTLSSKGPLSPCWRARTSPRRNVSSSNAWPRSRSGPFLLSTRTPPFTFWKKNQVLISHYGDTSPLWSELLEISAQH